MRVGIVTDDGVEVVSHEIALAEGDNIVRVGIWAWVRRANGAIDEQLLPDINLGTLTDAEQRRLLGLHD